MVGKEVASHGDPADLSVVALPEKRDEQPEKVGIRVGEANAVSLFIALGPLEHAARNVK
jgi:hypothetical protein